MSHYLHIYDGQQIVSVLCPSVGCQQRLWQTSYSHIEATSISRAFNSLLLFLAFVEENLRHY